MISRAGNPFRPTRPACCFSFQAVLGSPILTHKFKSITSRPMAATSVQIRTDDELNYILVYIQQTWNTIMQFFVEKE